MSSYPPPPPPPPAGGPYPPPYNPYTMRAQARAMRQAAKAQRRAARLQWQMQRRSLRRGSVVGPLLILALGIVFLLGQLGRLSWSWSLDWFGRWWPAVLIVAGLLLLLEWSLDRRRHAYGGHALGGGVISLLIFMAFVGIFSHVVVRGLDWRDHTFGPDFSHLDHIFGEQHDAYEDISSAIPAGATLTIRNPHGAVTVTGSSTDGQVHVNVHKQAYAWHDSEVESKERVLQPTFSSAGKDVVLTVDPVQGGQADLTITVPTTSAVIINAGHGDISVNQLHAPVTLSANHGDVDINGITGDVQASISDDNASLTLHSITGNVTIEGHSGDIEVADVTGALKLQGEFFGSTHVEHVNGPLRFQSNRTNFSAARLDDEFSIQHDSLDASQLLGPVVLKTSNKNITLDRVQGDVDLTDSNGAVAVTNAAPLGAIEIQNRHGSVDLGLPAGSGFVLSAQTRNGDMENDFSLSSQDQNDTHVLHGTIAGGGPNVTITTSDGDVTVRKSSVASLPPTPPPFPTAPAPPKITSAPPTPPKAPKGHRPPAAPKPPSITGTTF